MRTLILFFTFSFLCLSANSLTLSKGRCLFVDNYWIDTTTLKKTSHYPNYYFGNPILKADKQWEFNKYGDPYAAPFSGGIWFDEQMNKFKMWYSAGGGKKLGMITCYAESEDGKHWTKPTLDIVPNTNIVDTTEHDCVSVLLDKFEKNQMKRYKMFIVGFVSKTQVIITLKYSSDGIHWGKPVAASGEIYDRTGVYFDPFRSQFVLSLKTLNGIYRRARNYLAGSDPELLVSLAHRTFDKTSDKYIHYWFMAENNDPGNPQFPEIRPQIYNHEAIPYEESLLGYFTVWQGPENDVCDSLQIQKRNEVLIGWSRDGFNWNRENKHPFLPVSIEQNAWNAGNVQSTNGNPVIMGDSLYFYASGRYNNPKWNSNFSTGLAMLRRDGFVSMSAGSKGGYLITKAFSFEGSYLFVNADVTNGSLRVEILDEKGLQIKGFTSDECFLKKINSTKQLITWNNESDMSKLAERTIRLKFYITNGELYSFWISPWKTGESRGYTAGGGPGLNISGIDIKSE